MSETVSPAQSQENATLPSNLTSSPSALKDNHDSTEPLKSEEATGETEAPSGKPNVGRNHARDTAAARPPLTNSTSQIETRSFIQKMKNPNTSSGNTYSENG